MAERKRIPRGERLLSGTLSAYLSAVATTMTVSNPPSASKLPTFIELEPDSTSNRETVRAIDVSGNVVTIERGVYDGGVGKEHQSNSTYKQKITQKHWDAIADAVESGYLTEDSSHTLARTDADTFTITTPSVDLTAYYTKGRIVRFNGNDANLGIISSSSYSTNVTTVNLAKGSVPNPITSVEIAIMPRGASLYFALQSIQENSASYAADSGSANTYAVTLDPVPTAYTTGMMVAFKAANANSGASTLNVNGIGAKTIKKQNDQDLGSGDIESGQIVVCVYDGTNMQMISPVASGGTTPVEENILQNGNFINNSTNGYGGTPDDWTNSSANPVQGGFPPPTKQNIIDLLGVGDGDIEGLWLLNESSGNATDLSSNGYNLTDGNTVGSSDDGLLGKARDFEVGNSESLSIANASCANLRITGAMTFFAMIKPESINATSMSIMTKDDGTTNGYLFYVDPNGKLNIYLRGLTTNVNVASKVILQAGKWYFVAGVYDSSAQKLKVWVNGIKAEVTASGTHTDSGTAFGLGARGSSDLYFDGLIQMAGILSVALSDDQIKRLWAYTTYKGIKLRRSSSDGNIYQDLTQDEVEALRGKTLTVAAKMYQDTASIGQISIDDGSETASTTTSTTGSWVDITASKTISATATQIRIKFKISTSDGQAWYKEGRMVVGSSAAEYRPSDKDWARFPRLLRMRPPSVTNGFHFEEGRLYTWTPVFSGFSANPSGTHYYMVKDGSAQVQMYQTVDGTSNSTSKGLILPVIATSDNAGAGFGAILNTIDNGSQGYGKLIVTGGENSPALYPNLTSANWTGSGNCRLDTMGIPIMYPHD